MKSFVHAGTSQVSTELDGVEIKDTSSVVI